MYLTKNIKAIVFDLDDTLFPEHEFVLSGFKSVGDWILNQYTISNFFDVAWNLFKAGERGRIFNQALVTLGLEDDTSLIQELVQVYRDHKPVISLHEDARWAIESFKPNNHLGLITNGFLRTQQNKVRALGIESWFDEIIYCDTYGRTSWKPSPVPYQKMMEMTNFKGKEHAYIGDHPHKDFVAAKDLGWLTVRICRKDGEHTGITAEQNQDAHFRIESLYELPDIC